MKKNWDKIYRKKKKENLKKAGLDIGGIQWFLVLVILFFALLVIAGFS